MKVSDELREWASHAMVNKHADVRELSAIADRIDSEMIELPKDRDGVPIHVSDTVYLDNGREVVVTRIELSNGGNGIVFSVCGSFFSVFPSGITHTRPDSWERIADELDEQAGSLTKDGYTWQEDAIHDFAVRIRRLAEKDER